MEINIRYLRSEHNRYYKFPKADSTDSEDGHQQGRKEDTIYDLHSQNEVIRGRSVSSKVLSLDNSRKLVSLDVERNQWQKERLVRLNAKSKEHLSLKRSRKNSVGDKIRREESSKLFRLPELKRENLKTESKYGDSQELQSVIGHKMAT